MRRLALTLTLTLVGVVAAVEGAARALDLDARQRQAVRVARDLHIADLPGAPGGATGLDYLPRAFSLDQGGFTSAWGRCDFDHAGLTVLVMGDSVTRQVGAGGDPRFVADDPRLSWPSLLARSLPEDAQVCVFAEDGYHPGDLAAGFAALAPRLRPDHVLVQLCENDLIDLSVREVEPLPGGGVALYEPARERLAFAPLLQPGLYEASEAFRFLHLRLQARFGRTRSVPVPDVPVRPLRSAMGALAEGGARFLYVPPLRDPPAPPREPAASALREAGIALHVVDFGEPLAGLRRDPFDEVHLNVRGHARVADAARSLLER